MYAISVQQPWAWTIFHGKNVENRIVLGTWRRAVGERVAIHASKTWSAAGAADERVTRAFGAPLEWPNDETSFTRGAIIGTAIVAGLHWDDDCCHPWGEEAVAHLLLEDPIELLTPVRCRGALGLWTVPDDVAAELTR